MNGRPPLFALLGAVALVAMAPLVPPGDPAPPPPAAAVTRAAPVDGACTVSGATPVRLERGAATAPPLQATPHEPDASRRLAEVLAELDAGDGDASMVATLLDLLLAHPELAATFPEHVAAASRSVRGRTRLLQALSRSGDAGCQDALVTILTAASSSAPVREQALRSLGGVEEPTAATLASLWSQSHANAEQSRPALFAFGQATARVASRDPELHARCCRQLQGELRTATEPMRTGILLKALASCRPALAAHEAVSFLGATDASVRAIAAQVLLGGDDVQLEAIVQDLLRTEQDPEVRRIVLRGRSLRHRA